MLTILDVIERLTTECMSHGGFGHGKSAGFCPQCREWLERYFRVLGLLR